MRKWITLLMTLLVGASVSHANANTGQVSLEAGYRRDNISWRTSFPSDSPFLKTETKFKDLDIFQIGVHGRTTIGANFYVRAHAYWGWILDGDFERSIDTYFSPEIVENGEGGIGGDLEFGFSSHRHNVVDDKYVYGIGAAIGYPFYFCDCSLILAPVIGYAVDEQNICVEDEGFDLYADYGMFFPVSGSECCCHKWISKWWGPFVGVDFTYRPYNECWNIYAEFEYHWGSFHGKRHVNGDFSYFGFNEHRFRSRHADGWVVAVGADYDLCNCWTIGVSFKFQDWRAHKHRHHCYEDDEIEGFYFQTCDGRERNHHRWSSYAINLTVGREF